MIRIAPAPFFPCPGRTLASGCAQYTDKGFPDSSKLHAHAYEMPPTGEQSSTGLARRAFLGNHTLAPFVFVLVDRGCWLVPRGLGFWFDWLFRFFFDHTVAFQITLITQAVRCMQQQSTAMCTSGYGAIVVCTRIATWHIHFKAWDIPSWVALVRRPS